MRDTRHTSNVSGFVYQDRCLLLPNFQDHLQVMVSKALEGKSNTFDDATVALFSVSRCPQVEQVREALSKWEKPWHSFHSNVDRYDGWWTWGHQLKCSVQSTCTFLLNLSFPRMWLSICPSWRIRRGQKSLIFPPSPSKRWRKGSLVNVHDFQV